MTKVERNGYILGCHKVGLSQQEIGDIYSLSQGAVSQILNKMKSGASECVVENRGAKCKLNEEQLNQLSAILLKSPNEYGYQVWNKWSIKFIIEKEFGVNYHQNYIYKIAMRIGFSSQRPQLKDYRKKPEKVEEFKTTTVPEIKKKQRRTIDA